MLYCPFNDVCFRHNQVTKLQSALKTSNYTLPHQPLRPTPSHPPYSSSPTAVIINQRLGSLINKIKLKAIMVKNNSKKRGRGPKQNLQEGGFQDWMDAGKKQFRIRGIQEKRDLGENGFSRGGMQDR